MKNALEKLYGDTMAKIKANKRVPLLRVIRMKCADCVCWKINEIRNCEIEDCVLWKFRLGVHPIKMKLSDAKRKELSERAKKNFKY